MDLGESIKPHISRWATTGDRLMVENADSMADPAKKETEARFLPLSTYSVLGTKFVSVVSENNFGLSFATSWGGPSQCPSYYCSVLSSVDAAVQLSRLVEEGGSDPTNFLGG